MLRADAARRSAEGGDELLTLDTSESRLDAGALDDRVAQKQSSAVELQIEARRTMATLRAQIEQRKLDAQIFILGPIRRPA